MSVREGENKQYEESFDGAIITFSGCGLSK